MGLKVAVLRLTYWTFFFFGVLSIVAFWNSMEGWFEKAVLVWMSGIWPMTGATVAHIISRRWEKGWGEFLDTWKIVIFWVYGVLCWPMSYQMYKDAIDYYQTKRWYEKRGVKYPEEIVKEESFWDYLKRLS